MPVLEAAGLTKRCGETLALDQLNLVIAPGEIFCLLGQNGAGKTTTLNTRYGARPLHLAMVAAPYYHLAVPPDLAVARQALKTKSATESAVARF